MGGLDGLGCLLKASRLGPGCQAGRGVRQRGDSWLSPLLGKGVRLVLPRAPEQPLQMHFPSPLGRGGEQKCRVQEASTNSQHVLSCWDIFPRPQCQQDAVAPRCTAVRPTSGGSSVQFCLQETLELPQACPSSDLQGLDHEKLPDTGRTQGSCPFSHSRNRGPIRP